MTIVIAMLFIFSHRVPRVIMMMVMNRVHYKISTWPAK